MTNEKQTKLNDYEKSRKTLQRKNAEQSQGLFIIDVNRSLEDKNEN